MKNNFKKIKTNEGAAMLIAVIFFLFISLAIISGLVSPSVREFKTAEVNLNSKKSYFLAESGSEDAVYRVKNNMAISGSETITLGGNSATTTITSLSSSSKEITSLGDVGSLQRKTDLTVSTSPGVGFNYGLQIGQGGLYLNGGTITGNVYVNGPITASNSIFNSISGTAISANSPALSADQTNGTGTPANNVIFGNATATQDIAQSFQLATSSQLNKVQVYVKKVSTPADATVKIVNDVSGSPGTTVLASGTLDASTVSASYGWVNISFDNNPTLAIATTYWLVVDAGTSSTKYYTIGASSGGYTNGIGKIGKLGSTWNNTTPSGLDYYFSIYLGGLYGSIDGDANNDLLPKQLNIGTTSGTAQAHTVNYVHSTGNIYCASGSNNNKSCTAQADPTYIAYPISDANIADWEADAVSGGTTGSFSVSGAGTTKTLGPKKIVGDLSVSGAGTTLVVSGTLWVTGNLTLSGLGSIQLASSYGSNDGVIIVDGDITISGDGSASGSGAPGSYLMMVSNSSDDNAISVSGIAGAVVLYAPVGTVSVSDAASVKEVTAYKLIVSGLSSVTYESGLANNNFVSGPSGSWAVQTWGEDQ